MYSWLKHGYWILFFINLACKRLPFVTRKVYLKRQGQNNVKHKIESQFVQYQKYKIMVKDHH